MEARVLLLVIAFVLFVLDSIWSWSPPAKIKLTPLGLAFATFAFLWPLIIK